MPVQIGSTAPTFSEPTSLLSDCHRRIEMFLGVLKAAAQLGGRALDDDERRSLATALKYFREAAPKHTADEEESLFPRMRSIPAAEVQAALHELEHLEQDHRAASPLHELVDGLGRRWLEEGRLSREETGEMAAAVEKLGDIYRRHIEFEDRVVFPAAARVLTPEDKAQIGREMAGRRQVPPPPASGDRLMG